MHNWQDLVLAIGSIIFVIALVPSVAGKNKPALSTSLLTGTVLVVFGISYLTLTLWYAATTTFMTAVMWYILAAQKLHQSRRLQENKAAIKK